MKGTATSLPRKEGFPEEACQLDLKDDELTMKNRQGSVSRKEEQHVQRKAWRMV